MLVETYEIQEQTTEGLEDMQSDEALALIEQLDLKGQQALIARRTTPDGDTVTERNPYRLATAEELNVFRACFPQETPIQEFSEHSIPLRVLQVAAHAKKVIPTGDAELRLVVWHPEDSTVRDPILIARVRDGHYTEKFYLLARWGEALDEFEYLKEVAKRKLTAKIKEQIAHLKEEIASAERSFSTKIDAHLEGQRVSFGYFGSINF